MAFLKKANNVYTVLNMAGGLLQGATAMVVTDGSLFPEDGNYNITIWDGINYSGPTFDPNREIVLVTSRSGNTLQIQRAQEDTNDVFHAQGSSVAMLITAGHFEEIEDAISSPDASEVTYNSTYLTVEDALDHLLYVPPVISSFSASPSTLEKGSTVSATSLSWGINGTIINQSLNYGIGAIDYDLRSYNHIDTYTTNRTYILSVSDGTTSVTSNASVTFYNRRYWGLSSETSLTDEQIIALSSEFSTSKSQSRNFTPEAQYIYFAWPASWGSGIFTVNGLLNDAWVIVNRAFVNASGHSENYYIFRSQNIITDTNVQIIVS